MSGKDAQAHFDRGEAHLQRSEYNKAIADFDVAISLDDRCSLAYGMRGQAHYLIDEYTQAIADCNRAIDLHIESAYYETVIFARGDSYFNIGEYGKAIEDFDNLIELHEAVDYFEGPTEDEVAEMGADLYFRRGEAYLKNGEFDRALSDYREAIRTYPEFAQYVESAVLDALLEQKDTHSEKDSSHQPEEVQVARTATVSSVSQSVNPPRSGRNTANPSPRKRNSSSSSSARTKTSMRDTEPAWAFFGGFVEGVLIVAGFIAFFVTLIWFVVFITAWLFIPWFIVFCFFLSYLNEGREKFVQRIKDQWNGEA